MKIVSLCLTLLGLLAAGGALAQSGGQLLEAKGCLGCHAADTQKVGPSWKDVAAKYSGDKQAEAKLAANLREGKDHPVKADASDAELRAMAKTLLSAAAPAKPAAPAAQPQANLLEEKGCLACHAADVQKVGPSWKDIAAKYAGDRQAEAKLSAKLKEGTDHPVKAEGSEAEIRAMVKGVLSAQAAAKTPAKAPAKAAEAEKPALDNASCLGCHGNEGFSMPGPDGKPRPLHVVKEKFELSVHAKRQCVECHQDIKEIPHKNTEGPIRVGCVQCHESLWKAIEEDKASEQQYQRLGVVVDQIQRYMKSVHARPSREDQSRTNATCYNCHDAHYVYPLGSTGRADWRMNIPFVCAKCHDKQREVYATSVHGQEVLMKGNPAAAICSDCHTTHDIQSPEAESAKLAIVQNCGGCHADSFKTYTETYHGQVHRLGYSYTAKCYDCHGSHTVQRVSDPASRVHRDNRLATCQQCHKNATAGFVTFEPHATSNDFSRYPQVWIATKFMIALLIGVFLFFWSHTALWFYREWQDRRTHKMRPHVSGVDLHHPHEKQFQRFGPVWRLAHLLFAISVMTLVLTGMAVFFSDTVWAKVVVEMFGSPKVAAIVHRVAAAVMLGIFFIHLVYLVARIGRKWRSFNWFGPISMVPNWQDGKDIVAMFEWFLGRRPRPRFDRWTYWEKFDYWAVFWGMAIIGGSGMMLAFPEAVASVLPGWVFNVATIVHGEEAVLAAVFLFTVHFFNNHFRPDKFPLDLVMFTGAVPLEEFKREHALEYQRLKDSGELEKHLVDAPSRPMTIGSTILGFILISFGLVLLVMVITGFMART
jgi:predicted CXXCH cytochrome family protein